VIEANFDEDILFSNDAPIFLNDRVYKSHMSLQTCVKVLTRQDLKKCKSITLIHLSDRNSDEIKFKSTIEGKFGIPVTVAENGTEIILKTEI
jgi:phosphoribosyl 1,2-cyclic phosphodiesterase